MTPRWLSLTASLLVAVPVCVEARASDLPFDVRLGESEASLEIPVGVDEAWDLLLRAIEPLADGTIPTRPETGWISVADVWAVAEPVPYLEGRWSRVRVRVGSFTTEAERARAVDLLHTVEALHAEREAYRAWLASSGAATQGTVAAEPQTVFVNQPVVYVYPRPLWCSPWIWYGPTFYHLGGYAWDGYDSSYVSFGFGSFGHGSAWWIGVGSYYYPHFLHSHGHYASHHGHHHGHFGGCWPDFGHGHHGHGHHGGGHGWQGGDQDVDVDVTVIVDVPDDGVGGDAGGGDAPAPGPSVGDRKSAGLTGRLDLDEGFLQRRSPGGAASTVSTTTTASPRSSRNAAPRSGGSVVVSRSAPARRDTRSVDLPALTLSATTPWSTRARATTPRSTSGPMIVSSSGRTTTIARSAERGSSGLAAAARGVFIASGPFREASAPRGSSTSRGPGSSSEAFLLPTQVTVEPAARAAEPWSRTSAGRPASLPAAPAPRAWSSRTSKPTAAPAPATVGSRSIQAPSSAGTGSSGWSRSSGTSSWKGSSHGSRSSGKWTSKSSGTSSRGRDR